MISRKLYGSVPSPSKSRFQIRRNAFGTTMRLFLKVPGAEKQKYSPWMRDCTVHVMLRWVIMRKGQNRLNKRKATTCSSVCNIMP
ncbi:hypothetical protein Peur_036100 [Populus x canadensis]